MSVPTWEQLIQDLKIPEINYKFDKLGRVVCKKSYINHGKGLKIFYKPVSMAEVNRVRGRLYNR